MNYKIGATCVSYVHGRVLYYFVITHQSNTPISRFSRPCNELKSVWSMFSCYISFCLSNVRNRCCNIVNIQPTYVWMTVINTLRPNARLIILHVLRKQKNAFLYITSKHSSFIDTINNNEEALRAVIWKYIKTSSACPIACR